MVVSWDRLLTLHHVRGRAAGASDGNVGRRLAHAVVDVSRRVDARPD